MNWLALVLQFLPKIIETVVTIESSFKGTIPGAAKKDLVLSAITTSAKLGEQVPESHVQAISATIDGVVDVLNTHLWKKPVPVNPALSVAQ